MNLKTLKDIPSSFVLAKRALIVCLLVSILTVFGSLAWAYMITQTFKNSAFVLTEDGAAAFAKGIDHTVVDDYRKPEIINHIKVFHDLYWNIDQFNYDRNIDKSLNLIGNSGEGLYKSMKARGHFSQLESQNLVQKLKIDSIKVNEKVYPYKAQIYGKLTMERTDQKSKTITPFKSFFDILNVGRTENNPHGLLIENYIARTSPLKK